MDGEAPDFVIDDRTSECDRLALIEEIARKGQPDAAQFFPDTSLLSDEEAAAVILFCVQQLPFLENPTDRDIYREVSRTIKEGADCKGKTALILAGLWNRGIRGQALWVNQNGFDINHVLGATSFDPPSVPDRDAEWKYMEGSIRGARLGESPYQAAVRIGDRRAIGAKTSW